MQASPFGSAPSETADLNRVRRSARAVRSQCIACKRAASRVDQSGCLHAIPDALASHDGTFMITVVKQGLAVILSRRQCSDQGLQSSTVVRLENVAAFDDWCAIDPIRFEHPLLYDQMVRQAHALFGSDR